MEMEKLYKRLRGAYWVGMISMALVMGLLAASVWADVSLWVILLSVYVAALVAGLGINLYMNAQIVEATRLLLPVLDRDPDQFIRDYEELLLGKNIRRCTQDAYYTNMGTAYARKKCYREALSYYSKVNVKKLVNLYNKAVYWGDVALMHFFLEENDAALEIVEAQRKVFDRYPIDKEAKPVPELPFLMQTVAVLEANALGDKALTEERLTVLREHVRTERNQAAVQELTEFLEKPSQN